MAQLTLSDIRAVVSRLRWMTGFLLLYFPGGYRLDKIILNSGFRYILVLPNVRSDDGIKQGAVMVSFENPNVLVGQYIHYNCQSSTPSFLKRMYAV